MKPANPCNYFIDPNTTKKLVFAINPDDKPFYIMVNRRGWIMLSVLMWARDEDEVRSRLRQVIDFRRACMKVYLESLTDDEERYREKVNSHDRLEVYLTELEILVDGVDLADTELLIGPFIPEQMVQVEWADNSGVLQG